MYFSPTYLCTSTCFGESNKFSMFVLLDTIVLYFNHVNTVLVIFFYLDLS